MINLLYKMALILMLPNDVLKIVGSSTELPECINFYSTCKLMCKYLNEDIDRITENFKKGLYFDVRILNLSSIIHHVMIYGTVLTK